MDVRLAKALSHPLRQRLLVAYTEGEASPSDLAEQYGERLGDVAYHTKRLREEGMIELVRQERRRGAIKHFYRAIVRYQVEDEDWRGLPHALRRGMAAQVLATIWGDAAEAAAGGALDADDVHVSRTVLELDREAWDALSKRLRMLVDEALALEAATRERSAAGGDDPGAGPSELAILHFATRR